MNLSIPTVGNEAGPQYAFDINSSLSLIDQHDHSPGRGVQITPAGININADLNLQDNSLTNALSLVLFPQGAPSTTLYAISAAPGGGTGVNDLYYTDGTGTTIQITKNGIVNVVASSIPGESYSTGTFIWTQTQDSLPTTPANFDIGSITLRPNVALTSNGVILGPPSAIASQYNINLPLLPVSTSIMAIDSSGNITTPATTAFIVPSNAGTAGQFLRQSAGGTPLYQNPNANIQVKTANYTVAAADDLILCSGSAFNVTLPTAAGITGKTLIIKKTDSSLTNIISIVPNGVETIDAYTTYGLYTLNESLEIVSNGTNWVIVDHKTNTDIVNAGAITITATTTTPTKGTTTNDHALWRRQGNTAVITYAYTQTSAGNTGTGDYLFALPTGLVLDPTFSVFTSSVGTPLLSVPSAFPSIIPTTGAGIAGGSLVSFNAFAFSTSTFRVSMLGTAPSIQSFSSGQINFSATSVSFNFTITVPIANWRP